MHTNDQHAARIFPVLADYMWDVGDLQFLGFACCLLAAACLPACKPTRRRLVGSPTRTTVQTSSDFRKVHETLRIHSGYFQTHPLTAHFHKLKRRF